MRITKSILTSCRPLLTPSCIAFRAVLSMRSLISLNDVSTGNTHFTTHASFVFSSA